MKPQTGRRNERGSNAFPLSRRVDSDDYGWSGPTSLTVADATPPQKENHGGNAESGAEAAGAGAAGGMVKPKGQHGKGKLTSNDPTIKDLVGKYGENRDDCKEGAKKEMEKLSEQAKNAKSPKERNKLLRRKDAIKGAIKLLDRYFMKTPLLLTPFSGDQLQQITNGIDPNSTII